MNNPELLDESNRATYCPEDDKLRLYVGRVPRPEYDALRAEGWTSTPKQDCDFAAVWTPERYATCESYAGIVEDEDQGPEDRAADRAERFAGYRDRRTDEAGGHADRYDAGPAVHGYQSQARGERAAARHDRVADRALSAWDRADYWTHRTAGVISHALHSSSPDVRMGRIKTLEAELRKREAGLAEYKAHHATVTKIAADPAPYLADLVRRYGKDEEQAARSLVGVIWGSCAQKAHPRDPQRVDYIDRFLKATDPDPCTVKELAEYWLARSKAPDSPEFEASAPASWVRHLQLRIAYEWQMLEAQGGRESMTEMEKGGTLGGKTIAKVNKSPQTGRVVSVAVIGPRVEGWTYQAANEPGTPYALYTIKTERLATGYYQPPTDESRATLKAFEDAKKAALAAHKEKVPPCPLVNPTLADAERLQALINERYRAEWERHHGKPTEWHKPKEPVAVCQITQATYAATSKGAYARAETKEVHGQGIIGDKGSGDRHSNRVRSLRRGPALCKLRFTGYEPVQVIHITDKPAKALPAAVWEAYAGAPTVESMSPELPAIAQAVIAANGQGTSTAQRELLAKAAYVGWVSMKYGSGHWTDEGQRVARAAGLFNQPVTA